MRIELSDLFVMSYVQDNKSIVYPKIFTSQSDVILASDGLQSIKITRCYINGSRLGDVAEKIRPNL